MDLSSFYFDIRKDSLYCDELDSKKRKGCVTVLNIVLECLLKWFAPILVFTTEEIHSLISKKESSIHESEFVKIPNNWKNYSLSEKWSKLYKIKQEANIAIEAKRATKEIGSSLEADIKINVNNKYLKVLENLNLAEYFITSKAEKKLFDKGEIKVEVKKALGKKCEVCWKILEKKCNRKNCPI